MCLQEYFNAFTLTKRLKYTIFFISFVFIACIAFAGPATASVKNSEHIRKALENTHSLEIPLIENKGQIKDDTVQYYAKTMAGTVMVSKDGEILYTGSAITNTSSPLVKEKFLDTKTPSVQGTELADTRVHYMHGNKQDDWQQNLETYKVVSLGELYDNILVELKAYGNTIEKFFFIKPGGDPGKIQGIFEGGRDLKISRNGELEVTTDFGLLKFSKPVAYQEIDGRRKYIDIAYDCDGTRYGFHVGPYEKNETLIIDPVIAATFLGGNQDDLITSMVIANDGSGDVYVAGKTYSFDIPSVGSGSADSDYKFYDIGRTEGFIVRLNSSLSTIVAATFLGGDLDDTIECIALDSSGNVYIGGWTESKEFPGITASSLDNTFEGTNEAFLVKLLPDLSQITLATYLGGSNDESIQEIAIDSSDTLYITGFTGSPNFPRMASGADSTINLNGEFKGYYDGFVAKLDSNFSPGSLIFTYLGGSNDDFSTAITLAIIDTTLHIYVTGWTQSTDFPLSEFPLFPADNQIEVYGTEGFVTKFDSNLSLITASTYIGGSDEDVPQTIAFDVSGILYIAGQTYSTDFPEIDWMSADQNFTGFNEAFVTNISLDLMTIYRSTFLGGSDNDIAYDLAIDSTGNIYVSGLTQSSDFPGIDANSADSTFGPYYEGFIVKLYSTLGLISNATFLGGDNYDNAYTLAVDSNNDIFVSGWTYSTDFSDKILPPPGSADNTFRGKSEGFIAKLNSALTLSAAAFLNNFYTSIESGSTYTVCWERSPATETSKIMYSVNNGKGWRTIAKGLTDTCYAWQVPVLNKNKEQCRMKVIEYQSRKKKLLEKESNTSFSIEVLKILSPKNGDILTSGEAHTIMWETHTTKNPVSQTKIYYNPNGRKKWELIASLEGNPEAYEWTVPQVYSTENSYQIRIILKDSRGKKVVKEMSDGHFSIQPQ